MTLTKPEYELLNTLREYIEYEHHGMEHNILFENLHKALCSWCRDGKYE